ncbi:phage BR0599 family protein [Paracoccus versutus]|uniref:phage BR0599 family protein n=1 Tax=Paracoccus versutus TaxID=34007 RepID=UPI000DF7A07E|nr:phage BR0599 family protein [Paracoccus versutus]RDD72912.1 DUF2163 domain-containing protein [Paracoccus versutus]
MGIFDDNESQIETGFVSFTVTVSGDGETWRYTNSDAVLVDDDGNEYQPVPVMTSNIQADGAMSGGELDVTLDRSVSLADRFFPEAHPAIYKIVIRQAFHEEGVIIEAPLAFTGVITSVSSSGDGAEFKLKCTTQQGLLSRSGLRRRYQHQCPFLLFGTDCRANRASSQFSATISAPAGTAVSDVNLSFYGEDADNPEIWRGRDLSDLQNRVFMVGATIEFQGVKYVVWDLETWDAANSPNVFRIRLNSRDVTTLRDAVSAAAPADRVCVITPACDHTMACCQQVFSNGRNYGGMPWIPFENPVKTMFVGA